MNGLAREALLCCAKSIAAAADPREAAVRVAVAGNLLDSGAKIQPGLCSRSRGLKVWAVRKRGWRVW